MQQSTPLVNVQWLSQHLDDPNLVIIDTRFSLADAEQGHQHYQAGHIPGAYYLDLNQDLSSPVQAHGGRHPLPHWPTFVSKIEAMGIHSQPPNGPSQIVLYDSSRFAFAARAWWMLRYLGHEQVAILDGGFPAWQAANLPVSLEIPSPTVGHFQPRPQPDWIVNIETLRQQQGTATVVIDSRSPERWRGEVEPIDPIAGSVPGSINSFWQAVSTPDGRLKSRDELIEHWSKLKRDDDIIIYCGSGVTACVNLFSLVVAGHPMHRLYPGGWSDWCSYLSDESGELNSQQDLTTRPNSKT